MKISAINNISLKSNINIYNKQQAKQTPVYNDGNKQIYLLNNYLGRDLISFKANFTDTLKQNYFQLPPNCFPDKFQEAAGKQLNNGKSVLVVAPTGTGKTAIAHYAITRNMENNKKTFYTTPLKALSNQKYNEFKKVYGKENVGILTGDRKENAHAPVVVMTTEVYRNMALSDYFNDKHEIMENLGTVIFDEFHYLGDPDRGPVWEESIMFSPKDVQTLALSATVGNPEKLQDWITSLQDKRTELVNVPSTERHVPLKFTSFDTSDFCKEKKREAINSRNYKHPVDKNALKKSYPPSKEDYTSLVKLLNDRKQLPAIFFIFSKNYSRKLLDHFGQQGIDLTTEKEKKEIENIVKKYEAEKYLGDSLNIEALTKGYAMHNAGILPSQKELIEELFQKKLLKVVLATETLAAGINMPAKTVVISSSTKPASRTSISPQDKLIQKMNEQDNGMSNVRILTSNEFHQMAGRAGRRGIDTIGYVYTINTNRNVQDEFNTLIESESEPIISKLNPDYSFIAGYYKYIHDDSQLKDIIKRSFYAFDNNRKTSDDKAFDIIKNVSEKTNVLLERGFLEKKENGELNLTPQGELLSTVKGYAQLPLIESITKQYYKNFTPEMLATVIAGIANPADFKETAISYKNSNRTDTGLSDNIIEMYNRMYQHLQKKLPFFKLSIQSHKNLPEILNKLNQIPVPEESLEEINKKLEEYTSLQRTLEILSSDSPAYTPEWIADALEAGDTYSLSAMKDCLEKVEKAKNKVGTKGFDGEIRKIEDKISILQAQKPKGKAKRTNKHELNELEAQLQRTKTFKILDEKLFNAIGDGYNLLKRHSLPQVQSKVQEYTHKQKVKTLLTELKQDINGCISIQNYMTTHNITEEDITNNQNINKCFNKLLKDSAEIYNCTQNNGIEEGPATFGELSSQIVYNWTMMNKINKDSILNWNTLFNIQNPDMETTDEGKIYRYISQTIDLLNQVIEISDNATKIYSSFDDLDYYTQLKQNATDAIKLMTKDPIYFK